MLQLKKSIHLDSLRQPFKSAIVTAARLGAEAVEINGTREVRPGQMTRTAVRHIRKLLSDLNLKVSAIHFPTRMGYGDIQHLDQRIDATKSALKMAYELGCQVVVNRVGKIPEETEDPRWITMQQALTDIANFSHKGGAWLAAKTGAESGERLKSLIDVLPVHGLGVDFDPAELVINGFSPNDAMNTLAEHVLSCRARDAVTDLSLGRGVEVPMGQGSVDWPALLASLEERSYQGYMTVHNESHENILASCSSAMSFLDSLF
ncbi:MAG: sugar phosphate isomerase/epimerase family protein [Planctomycetota bacterium]